MLSWERGRPERGRPARTRRRDRLHDARCEQVSFKLLFFSVSGVPSFLRWLVPLVPRGRGRTGPGHPPASGLSPTCAKPSSRRILRGKGCFQMRFCPLHRLPLQGSLFLTVREWPPVRAPEKRSSAPAVGESSPPAGFIQKHSFCFSGAGARPWLLTGQSALCSLNQLLPPRMHLLFLLVSASGALRGDWPSAGEPAPRPRYTFCPCHWDRLRYWDLWLLWAQFPVFRTGDGH